MENKIVYKNLGANWGRRNIYIRSTDIESKNWERLLFSFPEEALYFMCLGFKIVIEDKSRKPQGKVQRVFAPAFTDFLRFLLKLPPLSKRVKHHTEWAVEAYRNNRLLKAKYDFYKHKLQCCSVIGKTIMVKREPDVWAALKECKQRKTNLS